MEEGNSKNKNNDNSMITSILEEAKRKNLMDWGELEIAESVIKNTQKG